jgi:L-ascorbate metabolism protein UlaG (beta-lactamase superfamily)
MKKILFILAVIFSISASAQQQPQRKPMPVVKPKTVPLPANVYNTLHDSCTQLDIVFITGKGGSMSLEGRNVKFFTSFVSTRPGEKKVNAQQDGTLMWQINGKAYLMGNLYFSGDSSGYISFTEKDKEYINALTPDGAGFLKTRGGK